VGAHWRRRENLARPPASGHPLGGNGTDKVFFDFDIDFDIDIEKE